MGKFLIRRILRAILTIWFTVTVVFAATRLTGDPTDWLLPDDATPQQKADMRVYLGIDKPITQQYWRYLISISHGDLGESFFEYRPVTEVYFERVPATLRLLGLSYFLAIVIGIPLGIIAALTRNSPLDRFLMMLCIFGYTVPGFVLGITLILIFSLFLRWLPSGGFGGITHYIMPVTTLVAASTTGIARLTRSSMLDVFRQDYMRTARAKGLAEQLVVMKHGLRNALVPVITILGLQIGLLIAGSVVIETVFAWPGVGSLIVFAALHRDFPVLQFGVIVVASTIVFANTLVDISYVILDPRVRSEG